MSLAKIQNYSHRIYGYYEFIIDLINNQRYNSTHFKFKEDTVMENIPNGKNLAYVRVSTVEQNEERQLEALARYNIDRTYIEKVSAKDTNRPKFQEMLDYAREGDTIYVTDFSRFSRSVRDLLGTLEYLLKKGVKVISLKENLDSSSPQGRLMITMIGAINEFERDILLERQREGIEIAKRKGKYKGRKCIERPADWDKIVSQYRVRKITAKKARELL